MTEVSQILVSHFNTPFSGCLQRRIRNVANITMELFFANVLNGFKLLTIYAKKVHRRCSTWLKLGFCLRACNIELALVYSLQIKPKKYSTRKLCDIVFQNAKVHDGTVNRTNVYTEAAIRRVL